MSTGRRRGLRRASVISLKRNEKAQRAKWKDERFDIPEKIDQYTVFPSVLAATSDTVRSFRGWLEEISYVPPDDPKVFVFSDISKSLKQKIIKRVIPYVAQIKPDLHVCVQSREVSLTLCCLRVSLSNLGRRTSTPSGIVSLKKFEGDEMHVILSHESSFKFFKEFCADNMEGTNCLFWEEIQKFRHLEVEKEMVEESQRIINEFCVSDCPKESSVSADTKHAIVGTFEKLSPSEINIELFSAVEFELLERWKSAIFPAFLRSDLWTNRRQDPALSTMVIEKTRDLVYILHCRQDILSLLLQFAAPRGQTEAVLFCWDVQKYLEGEEGAERATNASLIYNRYIRHGAPLELELTYQIKEEIIAHLKAAEANPTSVSRYVFSPAKEQVMQTVRQGLMSEFFDSPLWEAFLEEMEKVGNPNPPAPMPLPKKSKTNKKSESAPVAVEEEGVEEVAPSSELDAGWVIPRPVQLARKDKLGFLMKRGTSIQVWRRRWFRLTPTMLGYFDDEWECVLKGVIGLTEVVSVAGNRDSELGLRFCFGLVTPTRQLFMQAGNEKDRKAWVEALSFRVEELRKMR